MNILRNATGKTGATIATHSRPVGDTCPPTCPFLGAGCFAERGHCATESVKTHWRKNAPDDYGRWAVLLLSDLLAAFPPEDDR